ncbi:unnamed protein product [Thlaspi arvense]|uniref:1-aminocyclopropane-1-carboxylate synthase n=1 Tax=Thlaspi arvense TaxID=13288 RepID=A0AAU9S6K1_THLAR|nr:unnamed protein product [Thlaspi arvense]
MKTSYFLGWQEYEKNPYDQVRNPTGIIQMGLAENQLSFDLIESWLEKNPEPAGFKSHGESYLESSLCSKIIMAFLLSRMCKHFTYYNLSTSRFHVRNKRKQSQLRSNKLVLTAGATSANETLMFCIADPGEAFLLPLRTTPEN